MAELRKGLKDRNERAEAILLRHIKDHTPEDTKLLKTSIYGHTTEETVDIGFRFPHYGVYVHQGTLDFSHGLEEWDEAESYELLAWQSAQNRRGGSKEIIPPKGLMPRPFLVYGAVQAKKYLRAAYPPIN
jgi:hypothetical protein